MRRGLRPLPCTFTGPGSSRVCHRGAAGLVGEFPDRLDSPVRHATCGQRVALTRRRGSGNIPRQGSPVGRRERQISRRPCQQPRSLRRSGPRGARPRALITKIVGGQGHGRRRQNSGSQVHRTDGTLRERQDDPPRGDPCTRRRDHAPGHHCRKEHGRRRLVRGAQPSDERRGQRRRNRLHGRPADLSSIARARSSSPSSPRRSCRRSTSLSWWPRPTRRRSRPSRSS